MSILEIVPEPIGCSNFRLVLSGESQMVWVSQDTLYDFRKLRKKLQEQTGRLLALQVAPRALATWWPGEIKRLLKHPND